MCSHPYAESVTVLLVAKIIIKWINIFNKWTCTGDCITCEWQPFLFCREFSLEFFRFVIHVDLLIRHTTTSDKMIQKLLLLICNVGCQCQRSIHCQTLSCYSARRPIMPVKWVVYCVVLRDVSIGVTAVQWDSRRESCPLAQSFNKEPQLLLTNGAHRILTSSSPPRWQQPLCPGLYSDPSCLLKHITHPHREHEALTEALSLVKSKGWWCGDHCVPIKPAAP